MTTKRTRKRPDKNSDVPPKLFGEPYITSLVPWATGDVADPKTKPVVACDINTDSFRDRAVISGHFVKEISDGHLWWEDGMQAWVVHVVHILTDNIEQGVYCGYCGMNKAKHFMLLGKLEDGHPFTEAARDVLASYRI